MTNSKDKELITMIDEISRFSTNKEELIGIVCGIKDEDIEEFTRRVEKIKSNEYDELLETFIDFRNDKKYTNDDIED